MRLQRMTIACSTMWIYSGNVQKYIWIQPVAVIPLSRLLFTEGRIAVCLLPKPNAVKELVDATPAQATIEQAPCIDVGIATHPAIHIPE